jgi:hypothetical protein
LLFLVEKPCCGQSFGIDLLLFLLLLLIVFSVSVWYSNHVAIFTSNGVVVGEQHLELVGGRNNITNPLKDTVQNVICGAQQQKHKSTIERLERSYFEIDLLLCLLLLLIVYSVTVWYSNHVTIFTSSGGGGGGR